MTAIKAAFERAGLNTSSDELYAAATKALQNGAPEKVRDAFARSLNVKTRQAMELDYLNRVACDMAGPSSGSGHNVVDPLAAHAAPAPDPKPVNVHEHRRRTPEQRDSQRKAAMAAAAVTVEAFREARLFNGSPLRSIPWGQLTTEIRDKALSAASFLRQGTEATEDAILLVKIRNHGVVTDHTKTIGDVVKDSQLEKYMLEARLEAPKFIELSMSNYAGAIEKWNASYGIEK